MFNIAKKLSAILAAVVMTVTLATSVSAVAVDADKEDNLFTQGAASTQSVSSSSGTFSLNDSHRPSSYHNLDKSDYKYDGYVGNVGRLYSLKYFDTTADGNIFVEGFALSRYKSNGKAQNVIMEVYELDVNTPHYVITLDNSNVIETHADYQTMFYRFAIINLDPNKLYYIAFRNAEEYTGLDVWGYLSHDWTHYYNY